MDTFASNTALIGGALFAIAALILILAILLAFKRKIGLRGWFTSFVALIVLGSLGFAFISLSLFARTYKLLSNDTRIGAVTAVRNGDMIDLRFVDETSSRVYGFALNGDQWMIEGYILRWKPWLRLLGAQPYYKVTRFSGRWESADSTTIANYQLYREPGQWKLLMQYGQKLPLIDAVQGIAAFQYPDSGRYGVYISDAGFVLKK